MAIGAVMDFQVVVLAGGTSKKLVPLVSKDVPKALLPVANRPVLAYVIDHLEANSVKDIVVVVEGQVAAIRVGAWISNAYNDRLQVEVVVVPEDVGTAGALRAVAHHLTASDILVVSGDLVCDVPPGAVAAAHRRHDAAVTALLCAVPVIGPSETGSTGGKDKAKKPGLHDIIGLDSTGQFLLFLATGAAAERDIRVQDNILWAAGHVNETRQNLSNIIKNFASIGIKSVQLFCKSLVVVEKETYFKMNIRADLMDAHLYAFKRTVLKEVLDQNPTFLSIKKDVVPYLVRTQLRSEVSSGEEPATEEAWDEKVAAQNIRSWLSQHTAAHGFHECHSFGSSGLEVGLRMHKCCAYITGKNKYCARLNSIQAFSDINRDVVDEANPLSSYSFSGQDNIHLSVVHGSKTTIGHHCMLAEGSQMGDKCSVKRSIIGRHCRIGSNVKIFNSVVMNHVTIEDGCLVQGSVICSNVQLQEHVVLKDSQVGAGYVVTAGSEHRAESLARKEKS